MKRLRQSGCGWYLHTEEPRRSLVHRIIHRVAGAVFHRFMICFSLLLVFAVSGGLFFLRAAGSRHGGEPLITPFSGIIVFCIGGSLGLGIFLYFYHRKRRHPF